MTTRSTSSSGAASDARRRRLNATASDADSAAPAVRASAPPPAARTPGGVSNVDALVGCFLDGGVGAMIRAVFGSIVALLAEKLWRARRVSLPVVTHGNSPLTRALLDACAHFRAPYDAVEALSHRHASTIVASLGRQNLAVEYQREVLRMKDGGHVTLDWPIAVPRYRDEDDDDLDAIAAAARRHRERSESRPDGVPGVVGAAGGGGGVGACGSGGDGCAVDGSNVNVMDPGPPFRRSIPDQGLTVLRKRLATHWTQLSDDAPVLILMSGIAGGSHDKYLKHFLRRASREGYRVVAFNCRGTANSPLTTPQFYSASFTGDVRAVVEEMRGRWPDAKIFAAGWSLGANILTNYLGEEGDECPLSGAVTMCNPFDLNACDVALRDGLFGTVYSRAMAKNMRALFAPHAHLFAGLPLYDSKLVERAKTVRDFDEAVTRVTFGFPSVDAYYAASSSRNVISDVKTPLLVVQARDDPIAVSSATPRDAIAASEHVLLVETESGGHLGWTAGEEAPFGSPWPDLGAIQFLNALRDGAHLEGGGGGEGRGAGAAAAASESLEAAI